MKKPTGKGNYIALDECNVLLRVMSVLEVLHGEIDTVTFSTKPNAEALAIMAGGTVINIDDFSKSCELQSAENLDSNCSIIKIHRMLMVCSKYGQTFRFGKTPISASNQNQLYAYWCNHYYGNRDATKHIVFDFSNVDFSVATSLKTMFEELTAKEVKFNKELRLNKLVDADRTFHKFSGKLELGDMTIIAPKLMHLTNTFVEAKIPRIDLSNLVTNVSASNLNFTFHNVESEDIILASNTRASDKFLSNMHGLLYTFYGAIVSGRLDVTGINVYNISKPKHSINELMRDLEGTLSFKSDLPGIRPIELSSDEIVTRISRSDGAINSEIDANGKYTHSYIILSGTVKSVFMHSEAYKLHRGVQVAKMMMRYCGGLCGTFRNAKIEELDLSTWRINPETIAEMRKRIEIVNPLVFYFADIERLILPKDKDTRDLILRMIELDIRDSRIVNDWTVEEERKRKEADEEAARNQRRPSRWQRRKHDFSDRHGDFAELIGETRIGKFI